MWHIYAVVSPVRASGAHLTEEVLKAEMESLYFLMVAGAWGLSWIGLVFVSLIRLKENPARLVYPPGSREADSMVGMQVLPKEADDDKGQITFAAETGRTGLLQATDQRSRKLAAIRGLVMIAAFIRIIAALSIFVSAWVTQQEWDPKTQNTAHWHPEFLLTALRGALQSDFSSAEFVHYWADIMPSFGLVLIGLNLTPVWHNQEMHCLGKEWILCRWCSTPTPTRGREAGGVGSVVRMMATAMRSRGWCTFVTVWGRQDWFFWVGIFMPLVAGSLAIGFTKNCFANNMIGVLGWHVIWAKLMARPLYVVVGLYWLTASRGLAMDLQRAGLDGVLPVAHLLSGQHRSSSLGWWFLALSVAHTIFHIIAFVDLEPRKPDFFPLSLLKHYENGTVVVDDRLANLYTFRVYFSSLPGVTGYLLLVGFAVVAILMSTYDSCKRLCSEVVDQPNSKNGFDQTAVPASSKNDRERMEQEEQREEERWRAGRVKSPWMHIREQQRHHQWTDEKRGWPAEVPTGLHGFQWSKAKHVAKSSRAPNARGGQSNDRNTGKKERLKRKLAARGVEPCCRFHQRRAWHVIIAIAATILMTYVHGSKHFTGKSPVDFRLFSIVCMLIYVVYDFIPQATFCGWCTCSMLFPVYNRSKAGTDSMGSARVKAVTKGGSTVQLTLRIPKGDSCEPCRWGGTCCGFATCCGCLDVGLLVPKLRAGDYMVMSFVGDFIDKNACRFSNAFYEFGEAGYCCNKALVGRATHLDGSHAFTIARIDDWEDNFMEVHFLIAVQKDSEESRSFTRRLAAVTKARGEKTNLQLYVTGPYFGGSGKVASSGNAAKMLASSGVGCTASTSLLQEMIKIGRLEAQRAK